MSQAPKAAVDVTRSRTKPSSSGNQNSPMARAAGVEAATPPIPKVTTGTRRSQTKLASSDSQVGDTAQQPRVAAATPPARQVDPQALPGSPGPDSLPSTANTPIEVASLLFDPDWYRSAYADVAAAGLDPIRHFFDNGAREGRKPNPFFDTSWYLSAYADVLASKMNPFLHYLLYGAREGRKPRPDEA